MLVHAPLAIALEIADVLINELRILVTLVTILEDLCVLANLHEELLVLLRIRPFLATLQSFSRNLKVDCPSIVHGEFLAGEMIHLSRLDCESLRFATFARR